LLYVLQYPWRLAQVGDWVGGGVGTQNWHLQMTLLSVLHYPWRLAQVGECDGKRGGGVAQHCPDKKENQIFLIFKEIQIGTVAVIYEKGLPNI
jgi:hypothetical protein